MVFNSLHFLVFFGIVTSAYFLLAHRFRWLWLLIASCYFYMVFKPEYILILGFTIVVDYVAGILIENAEGVRRKLFLTASLLANIGVLAIYKYYFFIDQNVGVLTRLLGNEIHLPSWEIILPIGLSFHTFQAMSYTIEVFRGNQKAERHFGIYSLYVMFYPQLVAGPIERPQNLLHQFYKKHTWNTERVKAGLLQMLQGLFKKVVIADRLALVVDQTYADLPNQSTGNLFLASVFYSFQIYCDFSGYSDMAIGAAKVMGFDLMKNFNAPYLAKSIPDFWRRWHISLSTWFKDYVYFSLGGNRVSVPRWYLNIMIVFLISGIWHGASWNFVIWGALHGCMQLIGLQINRYFPRLAADSQKGLMKLVYQIWTFLLVNFAWIFFRLQKFSDIKLFFKSFLQNVNVPFVHQVSSMEYLLMLGLMGGLWWMDYKKIQKPIGGFWVAFVVSIVCIYLFGIFNVKQFIYFQF